MVQGGWYKAESLRCKAYSACKNINIIIGLVVIYNVQTFIPVFSLTLRLKPSTFYSYL